MKKCLFTAVMLFSLTACSETATVKPVEKIEQYQANSVINKDFLVAVVDTTTETATADFVILSDYQADQETKKPKFKLFETYGTYSINPCIRTKFGCSLDGTRGDYKITYQGLLGEGSTSIYRIEKKKVVPISFSDS